MLYAFLFLSFLFAAFYTNAHTGYRTLSVLWRFPVAFLICFAVLVVLFLIVILISCLFVNPKKLLDTPSGYFRSLLTGFCQIAFFFAGVQVHTSGMEQLPTDTRFLLVSNHLSALDPLVYYYAMPDAELAFLSKKEVFSMYPVAQIMRETLSLPLDRENDREALRSIIKAIQFLRDDKASIAVFPEGTRNKTSDPLLPFRAGAFKIAQKAEVPIVVCALGNTRAMTRNMFRRHIDVSLEVAAVIPPEELTGCSSIDISNRVHALLSDAVLRQKAAETRA